MSWISLLVCLLCIAVLYTSNCCNHAVNNQVTLYTKAILEMFFFNFLMHMQAVRGGATSTPRRKITRNVRAHLLPHSSQELDRRVQPSYSVCPL